MSAAPVERSYVRRAYRQLFELGRGGMARVYLAESLASGLRKLVVLKALNPNLSSDPEMREAFRREAELSAQMNHPNVVQVMEVVDDDETPVIVMEYLDGITLSSLLKNAGKELPLPLHLHILSQVLAGLHHFHELRDLDGAPLSPVHRDVSPQNIMVLHEGGVKVLDFGIAKVGAPTDHSTRTGIIKGKIQYMPPEQLLGRTALDRRADIFAVGVMLWEAAARRRLWQGSSEIELVRSLAAGAVPTLREHAPHVPDAIVQITERAMAVDCDRRFSSAHDMQSALERALVDLDWLARPRELSDFMARHFGARRSAQAAKLKAALRKATESPSTESVDAGSLPALEVEASFSASDARSAAAPGSLARRTDVEPLPVEAEPRDTSVAPRRRVRRRLAIVAASVICVVLAVFGMTRRQPSRTVVSTRAATPTMSLQVDALPRGALIFLDGKLLGSDHFSAELPARERKATLEVSAPGYLPQQKEINLMKDLELQIVLEREPAPLLGSTESGGLAVSPEGNVESSGTRARPSARKASSSGSKSSKCTPPYTFGTDGIKTYKPECF